MRQAILAIRPRALGDVVLTTPALRALHRGHPEADLDVVTEPRYADLLAGLPGVRCVLPIGRGAAAMMRLGRALRRRRYAAVVDFYSNARTALLTVASGAPRTFGYDARGRSFAYRTRVTRDAGLAGGRLEYGAASHLRLARAAGGVEDGLKARVSIPARAHAEAERMLRTMRVAEPRRALGVVPAGTWPAKTWPVSHAVSFARFLRAAGREIVLLVGPGEERVAAAFSRFVPDVPALPACDVGSLAALIARLGGVAGTDSGPRHLAAALGVPTFAWFGPNHPEQWTPPSPAHGVWWTPLPCRGCGRTACAHWTCLPGLHPQRAADLALEHFGRHVPRPADLDPAAGA